MLKRFAPPFLLACTVAALAGATIIGGGGLGQGIEPWAIWIECLGIGSVGAILAKKQPNNAVGWLMIGFGFFYGLNLLGEALAVASAVGGSRPLVFSQNLMMLAGWCFVISLALTAMLFLLFPNGQLISPRWRWVSMFVAITIPLSAYSDYVVSRSVVDIEDFLGYAWSLDHAGQSVSAMTSAIFFSGIALQIVAILVGAVSLAIRLHRSSGAERQQLKWVAFTVAMSALVSIAFVLNNQLALPRWVVSASIVLSGLLLPVGLGIALFRYRLYDIDRVISRTVTYGLVVALLAAVFVGAVALLSYILPAQDNLAVAASTLAIAALFNPLRRRVKAVVDRRFNRTRYNAQLVVDQFTDSLRHRVELQALVDDWLKVVEETMEPSSAGVWIKGQHA